jgi:hypothetical protein
LRLHNVVLRQVLLWLWLLWEVADGLLGSWRVVLRLWQVGGALHDLVLRNTCRQVGLGAVDAVLLRYAWLRYAWLWNARLR